MGRMGPGGGERRLIGLEEEGDCGKMMSERRECQGERKTKEGAVGKGKAISKVNLDHNLIDYTQ